ncbi:MAG: uroporphyrinogen-III synthase [Alphaproteobacteria bacterium]
MRVLITRPQQEAEPLAAALKARGMEPVIEPLLVVHEQVDPAQPLNLDGVQAILVTSSNGARALAHATDRRTVPVFAVGDATASVARSAGFTQVESAGGNVGALAQLAYAALSPEAGDLLYVSGTATAGDLTGPLERAGFTVRRAVLYDAKAADRLTQPVIAGFKQGDIDIVLFFSPRTAEAFAKLARKARIASLFKRCSAYCISQAVAMKATALDWKSVRVATYPTQDSLLTLIDNDLMNFGSVAGSAVAPAEDAGEDEEIETIESAAMPPAAGVEHPRVSVSEPAVPAAERGQPADFLAQPQPEIEPAPVAPSPVAAPAAASAPPPSPPQTPPPQTPPNQPPHQAPPPAAPAMPVAALPKRRGGLWRVAGFVLVVVVTTTFGFFAGRFGDPQQWDPERITATVSGWINGVAKGIGGAGTGGTASENGATAARIEQLERSMARLAEERRMAASQPAASAAAPKDGGAEIEGQLAATARMVAEVMGRIERMESANAARSQAGPDLSARLAEIEARLAASDQAVAELRKRADTASTGVNPQAIAALETRLDLLTRDVAANRERVGQVATTAAAQQAGRGGEALVLALTQLSDAVARGGGYAGELDVVRGFAGNLGPAAAEHLDLLAQHAATGVSTRLNLQFLFPDMARRVLLAHNPSPQDRLIDRLIRKVQGLISVRPLGDGAGTADDAAEPGQIIAVAESRLRADDLAGAVAALAELKGPAADAALPWVAEAQARLKTQDALRQLRTLAIAQHAGGARR